MAVDATIRRLCFIIRALIMSLTIGNSAWCTRDNRAARERGHGRGVSCSGFEAEAASCDQDPSRCSYFRRRNFGDGIDLLLIVRLLYGIHITSSHVEHVD